MPHLSLCISYVGFGLVGFYGISTIVGYLMSHPSFYICIRYVGFDLDGFYGISAIVGYLMPHPSLYIYISYATSSICRELLFKTQYEFGDLTVKAGKINQQMGFVIRFLNGASQEIKVKLNESRQLKFCQVKQLKENSTENSAETNFKEDSQLNEL